MEESQFEELQIGQFQARRPQNRLRQFAKTLPKVNKYVPLALKLSAQSVSDATDCAYTHAFDPVFSEEGILVTPEKSTPDAGDLYLNAAAAALSEVEKHDESAAQVLLKIIDYFASNARYGAPDYEKLMREREDGWRMAAQKQEEVESLKVELREEADDVEHAHQQMISAEDEACLAKFASKELASQVERLTGAVQFKDQQLAELTKSSEQHAAVRIEQERRENELFAKGQQLRSDYEAALIDEEQAREDRAATQTLVDTLQFQTGQLSDEIAQLSIEIDAKDKELQAAHEQNESLEISLCEDRARFDQLILALKNDNETLESEVIKAFVSKEAVQEFGERQDSEHFEIGVEGGKSDKQQNEAGRYEMHATGQYSGFFNVEDASVQCQMGLVYAGSKLNSERNINENLQPRPSQETSSNELLTDPLINSENFAEEESVSFAQSSNVSSDMSDETVGEQDQDGSKTAVYERRYRKYKKLYLRLKKQMEQFRNSNSAAEFTDWQKQQSKSGEFHYQPASKSNNNTEFGREEDLDTTTGKEALQTHESFKSSTLGENSVGLVSQPQLASKLKTNAFSSNVSKSQGHLSTEVSDDVKLHSNLESNGLSDNLKNNKTAEHSTTQMVGASRVRLENAYAKGYKAVEIGATFEPGGSDDFVATPQFCGSDEENSPHEKLVSVFGENYLFANVNGAHELLLDKKRGRQLLSKIETHIESSNELIHNLKHELDIREQLSAASEGVETRLDSLLTQQLEAQLTELHGRQDMLYDEHLRSSENLAEIYTWVVKPDGLSAAASVSGSFLTLTKATETYAENGFVADQIDASRDRAAGKSVIRQFSRLSPELAVNAENTPYAERDFFLDAQKQIKWEKASEFKQQNDFFLEEQKLERQISGLYKFSADDLREKRELMMATIAFLRKSKTLDATDFEVISKSLQSQLSALPERVEHEETATELLEMQNETHSKPKKPVYTSRNPFKRVLWVREHIFEAEQMIRLKAEVELEDQITNARFRFVQAQEAIRALAVTQREEIVRENVLQTAVLPLYVRNCDSMRSENEGGKQNDGAEQFELTEDKYAQHFSRISDFSALLISDEMHLTLGVDNIYPKHQIQLHSAIAYIKKQPLARFLPLLELDYCPAPVTVQCDTGEYLRLPVIVYIKSPAFLLETIRLFRQQANQALPLAEGFVEWLRRQYKVGDIAERLLFSVLANALFYADRNAEVQLFLMELNYGVRDYFVQQAIRFMHARFPCNDQTESTAIDSLQFSELFVQLFRVTTIVEAKSFYEGVILVAGGLSRSFEAFEDSLLQVFDLYQLEDSITAEQLTELFSKVPVPFDANTVKCAAAALGNAKMSRNEFRALVGCLSFKDSDELTSKASRIIKNTDLLLLAKGPDFVKKYEGRRKEILRCIGINNGVEAFVLCCSYCQSIISELDDEGLQK